MITFNLYNCSGKILNSLQYKIENGVLTVVNQYGTVKRKIKDDYQYTFKFTKTLVKANGGEDGLTKTLNKANKFDEEVKSPGLFNSMLFHILNELK